MPKALTFWAVIAAGLLLAWVSAAPPAPRPVSAPDADFSAERAMAHVEAVAREPHPTGSAANARVRDELVARLTALGFTTEIQREAVLRGEDGEFSGANVENIVAVLPGRNRSLPAVAMMAHYDSVTGSPGAADDGVGIASILEAARAIRARGPALRDLVVVITDGEEIGLFGATAFFERHPLARRIGLVVNLEARGSAGPAFMFETGPENAGLMGLYGRVVARPEASSLMGWVYDRMPNGTDFTIPKDKGVAGLNIALIGRPFDYHSATSTPANLDRGSLQHTGDQALSTVDALLRAPELPAKGADVVYADLFGRLFVAYPAWAGWLLLIAAAGLATFAIGRAGPTLGEVARSGAGFVLVLAFSGLIMRLVYRLQPVGPDFYQDPLVARYGLFFAGMALFGASAAMADVRDLLRGRKRWVVALVAVAAGVLCSVLGGFDIPGTVLAGLAAVFAFLALGRPLEPRGLWSGFLAAGLVVSLALQALAPEAAFLVMWPTLAAAASAAVLAVRRGPELVRTVVAGVIAAVALGWTLRMAVPLFDGLGLTNPELLAPFAALAAMLAAPFAAEALRGRAGLFAAAGAAVVGAGVLLVALIQPWSARTPQPSHVLWVVDDATGAPRLVSARPELDDWSESVLRRPGPPERGSEAALWLDQAWTSRMTRDRTAAAPELLPVTATRIGDRVRMTIGTGGSAYRELRLTLDFKGRADDVRINGLPAPGFRKPGQPTRLRWHAPREPLVIEFRAPPGGSGKVTYAAYADGWPAEAPPLPPRPATVMPVGSSDATVRTGTAAVSW